MSGADFSPDLSLLACPLPDLSGKIGIWEMQHQTLLLTVHGRVGIPLEIRWSPDGRVLAFGGREGLSLMSVDSTVWSEVPACAVWRLMIGDTISARAVGHPEFTRRFAELPQPESRPFGELVVFARQICSQLGLAEISRR
jgi:WD40 repeat protein